MTTTEILKAIGNIRENQSSTLLDELLDVINQIFPKVSCVNVSYTKNTDMLPFGIMVIPILSTDDISQILSNGDDVKVFKYSLEIDSKIYEYGLDDDEILSIMIYNIYHMTNDYSPIIQLRDTINHYFADHGTYLHIRESIKYQDILALGLIDTLVKFTNCLYLDNDVVTDAYLVELELEDSFISALGKLFNRIPDYTESISRSPKLIILDWCFTIYNDVEHTRIRAIKQLTRSKELTGSVLYKRIIDRAINALNTIDTDLDGLFTESVSIVTEGKKGSLFSQIKYNGLRGIEDDFYEYIVRARNAETEEEVMYALKQINVRLSILDDYIRNEPLSDEEKKRWSDLYNKYSNIRDEIANKKVYNKKNYGIFFDYNQLDKYDEDDY